MPAILTDAGRGELISAIAAESNEELAAAMEGDFAQMTALVARFILRLGECNRRQAFRDDGATSVESWTAERFGVSTTTARAYAHVGEKAPDMPHLVESLCAGDLSFDKVRAVADVATPATDRALCVQAKECTVRELADIAQMSAQAASVVASSGSEHERRYLRFNDRCRTLSAQLPAESYARARACIDALAQKVPSEAQTPLDQRRCDGFMAMVATSTPGGSGPVAGASPYVVVVHAPLDAMVDGSGGTTELAAELERDGLIDCATVRRIACDATIVIALDDDVGHTMYEGRAQRFATDPQRREVMRRDRQCRFAGCTNVTFTNVHHVVPWKPGGTTDLFNLALLCEHHHGVVHRKGWTMSGNANEELTIVAPNGRVMTSRPSPLWTRVGAGSRAGPSG